MSLPRTLRSSPPPTKDIILSFPAPHVLLVTLNRPAHLNAVPSSQHAVLERLYSWYDAEPSLRCAVLTGAGRAFCAGADLKEWDRRNASVAAPAPAPDPGRAPPPPPPPPPNDGDGFGRPAAAGFGGLSNRAGKKPVVAAVNGLCLGGGMEMAINCDLVVAAAGARFGLPEVTRGVIALAGALPRLVRTVGRQRAAEMALVGGTHTAAQLREWGLVNAVAEDGAASVREALRLAGAIAANSPDAVIVTREGLRLGWEGIGPEAATDVLGKGLYGRIDAGENMQEGVRSFVEKRKPAWKDSKL